MCAARTDGAQVQVGFIGARHPHILQRVHLLANNERATVLGFVEEDDAVARELEERLDLKRFETLDELLLRGVDVAVVEALDPDVPKLARACIGRVKSVLIEKPGADRPEFAYPLARLLREAGTVVEFGYEMHYADCMRSLRRVLSSGCLGQVTLARFHGGNPVGCALELWQSLPDDLGGVGYTEGCHLVELVTDLFGVPEAVSALAVRLPPGEALVSPFYKAGLFSPADALTKVRVGTCKYEDLMTTTLVYHDKLVTVDLTAWEARSWVEDWSAELYGTNGTVRASFASELVEINLREERGGLPSGQTVVEAGKSGLGYMYERQLGSLISRTLGNPAAEAVGLEAGMGVLRVLEAAYASAAASGKSVVVPQPK